VVSHKLVAHSVIETGGEAEWMMLCFQYLDNPRLRVVGNPYLIALRQGCSSTGHSHAKDVESQLAESPWPKRLARVIHYATSDDLHCLLEGSNGAERVLPVLWLGFEP